MQPVTKECHMSLQYANVLSFYSTITILQSKSHLAVLSTNLSRHELELDIASMGGFMLAAYLKTSQ